MWLLDTKTARLKFFNNPEDVPGGYAILSHVWGEASEEDTFQKVQEAARQCDENTKRVRPGTSGASLEEVVAQQQKRIEKLERMFEALSTRVEKILSGSLTPSEYARSSASTATVSSRATLGDLQPARSCKVPTNDTLHP